MLPTFYSGRTYLEPKWKLLVASRGHSSLSQVSLSSWVGRAFAGVRGEQGVGVRRERVPVLCWLFVATEGVRAGVGHTGWQVHVSPLPPVQVLPRREWMAGKWSPPFAGLGGVGGRGLTWGQLRGAGRFNSSARATTTKSHRALRQGNKIRIQKNPHQVRCNMGKHP